MTPQLKCHYFILFNSNFANSFKTFQTTLAQNINTNLTETSSQEEINEALASKLKIDEWCYDEAYTRIETNKAPSLKCKGTKLTKYEDNTDMYVGTLTADEIVFAGGKSLESNQNFYLVNKAFKKNWWLLSLYSDISVYEMYGDMLFSDKYDFSRTSRPAATIKIGITITDGDGTLENPYTIN